MLFAPEGARTIILHLGEDEYNMIDHFLISSLDFDEWRKSRRDGERKAG
jgi:hypothetical protein